MKKIAILCVLLLSVVVFKLSGQDPSAGTVGVATNTVTLTTRLVPVRTEFRRDIVTGQRTATVNFSRVTMDGSNVVSSLDDVALVLTWGQLTNALPSFPDTVNNFDSHIAAALQARMAAEAAARAAAEFARTNTPPDVGPGD